MHFKLPVVKPSLYELQWIANELSEYVRCWVDDVRQSHCWKYFGNWLA